MGRTRSRALAALLAAAILCGPAGCAAFNQGLEDALAKDMADEADYGWGHELYEMPVGLIGFPIFLALSPFLYWIPGGPNDEFGYPLGKAFGGDFIYIDPTENYR